MKLEDIKKLQQRKYREEFGHFLVEGEHLILELQKAAVYDARLRASEIYVTPDYSTWRTSHTLHVISARQMAQLCETHTPQGIAAVVPLLGATAPQGKERAVYLYEIQDPGNLGTILRTLAWFGGFRCLLSPGSVDVHNAKAIRASMGAIFHVPIECGVPIEALAARFPRIACLDLHGTPIGVQEFKSYDCYLFGNEGRGLPRERMTALQANPFSITGKGPIESLNVAAAVTICQYEVHRPSE